MTPDGNCRGIPAYCLYDTTLDEWHRASSAANLDAGCRAGYRLPEHMTTSGPTRGASGGCCGTPRDRHAIQAAGQTGCPRSIATFRRCDRERRRSGRHRRWSQQEDSARHSSPRKSASSPENRKRHRANSKCGTRIESNRSGAAATEVLEICTRAAAYFQASCTCEAVEVDRVERPRRMGGRRVVIDVGEEVA
jgi:hypothetical protein